MIRNGSTIPFPNEFTRPPPCSTQTRRGRCGSSDLRYCRSGCTAARYWRSRQSSFDEHVAVRVDSDHFCRAGKLSLRRAPEGFLITDPRSGKVLSKPDRLNVELGLLRSQCVELFPVARRAPAKLRVLAASVFCFAFVLALDDEPRFTPRTKRGRQLLRARRSGAEVAAARPRCAS